MQCRTWAGLNQDNDKNPLPLKCPHFSFLPKPRKFSFYCENGFIKGFGVGSFQKRQRVFNGNKEEGFSPATPTPRQFNRLTAQVAKPDGDEKGQIGESRAQTNGTFSGGFRANYEFAVMDFGDNDFEMQEVGSFFSVFRYDSHEKTKQK